jgi:putative ATP-dependent endonuclease of OLD family
VATLIDFLADDPDRNPEWFRDGRAIPKWYDPVEKVLHPDRTNDRSKLACQIGLTARFDRDDIAVDVIRYFHDDDDVGDVFDADVVSRIPAQLIRDVGFFLVPANRTWDRTISFGSELFRRAVASIGGPPAAAVLSERDRLRAPDSPLESDPGLADIVANVESEVRASLEKRWPSSFDLRQPTAMVFWMQSCLITASLVRNPYPHADKETGSFLCNIYCCLSISGS